jgi:hypothetical protein
MLGVKAAEQRAACKGRAMRQVAFWFPIMLVGPWTWLMFGGLTDAVPTRAEPHTMSAAATAVPDLWTALVLSVWAVVIVLSVLVAVQARVRQYAPARDALGRSVSSFERYATGVLKLRLGSRGPRPSPVPKADFA